MREKVIERESSERERERAERDRQREGKTRREMGDIQSGVYFVKRSLT